MKKRIANIVILAALVAGTCGWAVAQAKEEPPDRAVVPLSDPAKPAKIEVSVMRGSVTVRGYEGRDVIVEARVREKALSGYYPGAYGTGNWTALAPPAAPAPPVPPTAPAPPAAAGVDAERVEKELQALQARDTERLAALFADQEALAKKITGQSEKARQLYGEYFQDAKKRREEKEKKIAGMKQLSGATSGLEIEESGNVVTIGTESWKAATDLVIQVPRASSLEIRSSMDGEIVVEGIGGEIDINNINGPVTLRNVSGNTLVHTVNGDITADVSRIPAGKPLSFSSMRGDIDVTLPADVKASLKMKSEQGEIYSDFDMTIGRKATRAETAEKTEQGKFHITFDKSLLGLVNGGGAEISFNTFRGDIYIRKRK
jgi:ketosteroid isomerase-like protein